VPRIPYFPDSAVTDLEIRLTLLDSRCGANRLTITQQPDGRFRAVWWLRDGTRGIAITEMTGTMAEVHAAVNEDSEDAPLGSLGCPGYSSSGGGQ
jgi:hypothetical protein